MVTDLLKIEQVNDQDVVDSRLIAAELGIEHRTFYRTISDNQIELEEDFGQLCFSHATVRNSVGAVNEVKYAYLNEDQATYLMTLSKNTPKVKTLKRKLVKSFSAAKKIIKEVVPQQSETIQILQLQNENLKLENSNLRLKTNYLNRTEAIVSLHGIQTFAFLVGDPDAVVEVVEKVTETIVCKGNSSVSFEGKSTAQLGKELGFKTGTQLEKWLKQYNLQHLVCQGLRAVQADYIPTENVRVIREAYYENKNRQRLLGEQ
jgi:phage regulator Rha-like protein